MSRTRSPRTRASSALALVAAGSLAAATLALTSAPTVAAPAAEPTPLPKGYAGAPVNPTPYTITQPDGSTFQAYRFGDRLSNGVATVKGDNSVVEGKDGYWRYAAGAAAGGELRASSVIVGRGAAPAASKGLAPEATAQRTPNNAPVAGVGDDTELVILVSFADQDPVGSTPAEWHEEYFGGDGSVDAFYDEASQGQFGLQPAAETSGTANDGVVGWIELPYDHPNTGVENNPDDYIADSIAAASDFVDFASYDKNGDGELTTDELHITVIGAGYETSYSGPEPDAVCGPSIWGHQWELTANGVTAPVVDGVKVGESGYTTFGEFHCDASSADPEDNPGHKATMGIMAHEFGHDINWPDLYDVDYSSEGVGSWSLMSGGSWGYVPEDGQQPGASPSHPDAWSLYYQGWVVPQPVTAATADVGITVGQPLLVSPNPDGVDWLFNETEGDGEYFILENRQQEGFDSSLPGCGVIAYRINESVTPSNAANMDEDDPLVDVLEADGDDVYQLQEGDPFPGADNVLALNGSTTPSTDFHDGTASGLSVDFDEMDCATTMRADITPGVASPPVTRPANDPFAAAATLPDLSGSVSQSTEHATVEPGEPKPAGSGRASVWFTWTAPVNGELIMTTMGSDFDTAMAIYTGTTLAGLKEVVSNDDQNFNAEIYTSRVVTRVAAGQTYLVNAGGYGGDNGQLQLSYSVTVDAVQPPAAPVAAANDSFDRKVKLKGKKGSVSGSTVAATTPAGEKVFKGETGTNSVWYSWRAKKTGKVTFEASGSFAPWLAVARGKKLSSLEVLKADTSAPTGKVKVNVTKGKRYVIVVDGGSGTYTLTWK